MVLYLVGTCHADIKGPERLEKFLNFVRPSSICHESSTEAAKTILEERIQEVKLLLKRVNHPDPSVRLATRIEFIYGYEIWVPYQHLVENPTVNIYPLEEQTSIKTALGQLIKQSANGDRKGTIPTWAINMQYALTTGDSKEYQKNVDAAYYDSKSATKLILDSLDGDKDYILKERDSLMEKKIRATVANDREGTVVVNCGVGHFFGEYDNLYERLRDISPCRIRLPEIDKF